MKEIGKQSYQTTESTFTPTAGRASIDVTPGNKQKKFKQWLRRNKENQIYVQIDNILEKAGVKIEGKHPYKTPEMGRRIESSLYTSLQKKIGGYLDSLTKETPQHEVIHGVMDVVKEWTDSTTKDIDEYVSDLFLRGFVAGAIDAKVEPSFGKVDQNAMEWITKNPKRIGSRIKLFSDDLVEQFRDIIAKSYGPEGEFSLYGLTKEMSAIIPDQRYQIERIARTETSQVSNSGRLWSYSQDDDRYFYNYRWNAVVDSRSKPISVWRYNLGNLSYDEAEFLWEHQEQNIGGKWYADWPNQRCSLSRSPIEKEFKQFRFEGMENNFRRTA